MMKKTFVIFGLLGIIILGVLYATRLFYDKKSKLYNVEKEEKELSSNYEIHDGDLIFQTSLSGQSKAIQLATKSEYSHCGIIYKDGEDFYVFEAVQPVKKTKLDKWIARGKDGHFVIKRLKNADKMLTDNALAKMKQIQQEFNGKDYDLTFEWSDNKIYCSELIWKVYQRATGVEIGKLEKLRDFDLTSEIVKNKMKERYGDNLPLDEFVISPKSIFESELLKTIKTNWSNNY